MQRIFGQRSRQKAAKIFGGDENFQKQTKLFSQYFLPLCCLKQIEDVKRCPRVTERERITIVHNRSAERFVAIEPTKLANRRPFALGYKRVVGVKMRAND